MADVKKVNIGVIGCGNISGTYFEIGKRFRVINFVACADIDMERARLKAKQFDIPKTCTFDELLNDPDIELVINLTTPNAHAEVGTKIIQSNKHLYSEKPLATNCGNARNMLDLAASKGVRVGCAPDTFLGGGLQTCRKVIDNGLIGEPIGATAFMMFHGHESWHPEPDFYYQAGGGPMFDMGPYYLTTLIALLGPVRRVTGSARISIPERMITSQPNNGKKISVQVPTHIVGTLDFASGLIASIIMSFDVWSTRLPTMEIYGTEGTLSLPDPNTFGGPVAAKLKNDNEWKEIPLTHGFSNNSRSLGVADMAYAMRLNRDHRANGALAYHVLDIMQSIHESSLHGKHVELSSTCDRPLSLPLGSTEDILL